MHKSLLFAIAGAGIVLAGCNAGNHRHTMIPVDDVSYDRRDTSAAGTGTVRPAPAPAPAPIAPPAAQPAPKTFNYVPMTGVTSSGGVDSVPGKKAGKKVKNTQSGKTVAPGGTYVVQRGDTPERIARRHKVRLSALMSANNLTEASARRLQIGQKLVIPAANSVQTSKSKASSAPAASEKLGKGKYRVQRGDTPERIARKHKVRVRELLAANNLNDESARRLQIGQILTIPGAAANTAQAAAPETKSAPIVEKKNAPKVEKTAVTAEPSAASDSTAAVQETDNSGTDVLADAVLWEAKEATTYAAVAAQYNISEAKLREMNDAGAGQNISQGEFIYVPKKK